MKVLSKTALGMILNRHSDSVQFLPTVETQKYINDQYMGDANVWDSGLLENTEGSPEEVSQWMSDRGFKSNFTSDASFALAALLHIKTKFMSPATKETFSLDDTSYKRAIHTDVVETYGDDNIFELTLFGKMIQKEDQFGWYGEIGSKYEAREPNKHIRMFISEKRVTPLELERANVQPEARVEGEYLVHTLRKGLDLHVPFVEATLEESIDELIGMAALVNGEDMEVSSCELETRFTMDNKGAEVKQMASMSMKACGCLGTSIPVPRRVVKISSDFYVYITYDNSLAVALKMEEKDFIKE